MRENGYNMGRDNGNRSSAPRKSGNSIWAGILVGILVGAGMAAGVAWYLTKSPSPFTKKEQQPALAKPEPAKPTVPAAADKSSSTTSDGKPRFEFYNVLTNKPNANAVPPAKPAERAKPVENPRATDNKAATTFEPQILQAGSFSNVNDAEKLKAKLALLGVEANIQSATIPDKGVWYRVRLGPYKSADDMNRASSFLKQNGVESTPMRAQ